MEDSIIKVGGMSCQGCVKNITGVLSALPGAVHLETRGAATAWSTRLLALLPPPDPAGAPALVLTGDAEAVAHQLTISPCVRTITACFAGPSVAEPLVIARVGNAANDLVWVTSLAPPAANGTMSVMAREG